jgi:hypothetical protein
MQVSAMTFGPGTDADRRVTPNTFNRLEWDLESCRASCVWFTLAYCAVEVGNTTRTHHPSRIRHSA